MPFPKNSKEQDYAVNSSINVAPPWQDANPATKPVKIATLILILIVSLASNLLLILVVRRNVNKRMRTPNNYFILNMAFSDILLVLYVVPQYITMTACDMQWLIDGMAGNILCRFSFFIGQMPMLVSTGSLFFITLDRFFLVFFPLRKIITLHTARRIMAAVWTFALLLAAPLLAMSRLTEIRSGIFFCTFDFSLVIIVINYFLFCYFFIIAIPILTIIIMYIAIGFKIKQGISPGNQLPSHQERRERVTHKVLAMLVAIVVALIVFRFPLILLLIACFTGSISICSSFNLLFAAWLLTFANTGVNPLIYFIFNEQFRHGAILILQEVGRCCFKGTNEVHAVQPGAHQTTGSLKHETVQFDQRKQLGEKHH